MVNKYITLAFVMLFALTAIVSASVGSPDVECQENGFDYGIVKYECDPEGMEQGSYFDMYNISGNWNECTSFDWTSDPAVDGIVVKAGQNSTVISGGENGTVEKFSKNDISHITFCADEPPVVPEFGLIAGLTTIAGAVAALLIIRRN